MRVQPAIAASTVVIGVDLAKRSLVAVALHGDGRRTKPRRFKNEFEGFEGLLAFCQESAADSRGFVVAFEPTGHYGEPLVQWLMDEGVALYQVQPLHTKRAKELFDGTRRKTDAKDALVIAELCRRGTARPYAPLEGPFAELRVLARQREQLVKRRGQILNRLHRHLDVVFPELTRHFYRLDSAGCRYILATAPLPRDILEHCPKDLVEGLRRATRGSLDAVARIEQLRETAARSKGVSRATRSHRLALAQGLDELAYVGARIAEVEHIMKSVLAEVDYAPRLLSIPNLGEITAAILLAEFGDLREYRVAKQLIAMAGLDLVESSSGNKKGRRHISRRGRRYVRQILYLAVLRLGRRVFGEHRRRLVEVNKLPATKAAVANMCRLLRIIHALVRDDVDFDVEHPALRAPEAAA